jgi:hypothetical protein
LEKKIASEITDIKNNVIKSVNDTIGKNLAKQINDSKDLSEQIRSCRSELTSILDTRDKRISGEFSDLKNNIVKPLNDTVIKNLEKQVTDNK